MKVIQKEENVRVQLDAQEHIEILVNGLSKWSATVSNGYVGDFILKYEEIEVTETEVG